jgi:hypothetical protein
LALFDIILFILIEIFLSAQRSCGLHPASLKTPPRQAEKKEKNRIQNTAYRTQKTASSVSHAAHIKVKVINKSYKPIPPEAEIYSFVDYLNWVC